MRKSQTLNGKNENEESYPNENDKTAVQDYSRSFNIDDSNAAIAMQTWEKDESANKKKLRTKKALNSQKEMTGAPGQNQYEDQVNFENNQHLSEL